MNLLNHLRKHLIIRACLRVEPSRRVDRIEQQHSVLKELSINECKRVTYPRTRIERTFMVIRRHMAKERERARERERERERKRERERDYSLRRFIARWLGVGEYAGKVYTMHDIASIAEGAISGRYRARRHSALALSALSPLRWWIDLFDAEFRSSSFPADRSLSPSLNAPSRSRARVNERFRERWRIHPPTVLANGTLCVVIIDTRDPKE